MFKEWLNSPGMLAGAIIDIQEMSKKEVTDAVWQLAEGISMRGHALSGTFVLVCRAQMYELLRSHWPELDFIWWDDIHASQDVTKTIMCVISDDQDLPAHYVVLTDLEKLRVASVSGEAPFSAIVAVKGFVDTQKPKQMHVWNMGLTMDVYVMLNSMSQHEFDGAHNPLSHVVVHSDSTFMQLVADRSIQNDMFLGRVMVKTDYDKEKSDTVDVVFVDGSMITFHPGEAPEETNAAPVGNENLEQSVANGKFGL